MFCRWNREAKTASEDTKKVFSPAYANLRVMTSLDKSSTLSFALGSIHKWLNSPLVWKPWSERSENLRIPPKKPMEKFPSALASKKGPNLNNKGTNLGHNRAFLLT